MRAVHVVYTQPLGTARHQPLPSPPLPLEHMSWPAAAQAHAQKVVDEEGTKKRERFYEARGTRCRYKGRTDPTWLRPASWAAMPGAVPERVGLNRFKRGWGPSLNHMVPSRSRHPSLAYTRPILSFVLGTVPPPYPMPCRAMPCRPAIPVT